MTARKRLILSCMMWVIICLLIANLAGWVTSHNLSDWFVTLTKPSFNPPSWVFGPVWTVLYIMIGCAGGFLWQLRQKRPNLMMFYLLQLILNFSWSFIFFGERNLGLALVDISLLWLSIIVIMSLSYRASKTVFWLLAPYLLWVSFACVLNYSLWRLN